MANHVNDVQNQNQRNTISSATYYIYINIYIRDSIRGASAADADADVVYCKKRVNGLVVRPMQ